MKPLPHSPALARATSSRRPLHRESPTRFLGHPSGTNCRASPRRLPAAHIHVHTYARRQRRHCLRPVVNLRTTFVVAVREQRRRLPRVDFIQPVRVGREWKPKPTVPHSSRAGRTAGGGGMCVRRVLEGRASSACMHACVPCVVHYSFTHTHSEVACLCDRPRALLMMMTRWCGSRSHEAVDSASMVRDSA